MSRSLGKLLLRCTALAAGLALAGPAAAQQTDNMAKDTAMTAHDSTGHDSMGKDETGMEKDKMGTEKDKMGMEKDKMGHDGMAMAPHAMMMAAEGHEVAGTVTMKTKDGHSEIELGDDFSVPSAKDVEVVLSRSESAAENGSIKLGKLKKPSGAQSYAVPAGTSVSDYSHLVLWSKKEKAVVGSASLASSGDAMHK